MARILSDRDDIRQWAEARAGTPMIEEVPDPRAGTRSLLQISFGQHVLNADNNEGPDRATGGFQLVSWDDWLAELERQDLAIKVNDEIEGVLDNDFRFVTRGGDGETTDAAEQPPAAAVGRPHHDEEEDDLTPRKARFGPGPAQGREPL